MAAQRETNNQDSSSGEHESVKNAMAIHPVVVWPLLIHSSVRVHMCNALQFIMTS